MKLNFASVALALALPTAVFAQKTANSEYPNTFTSGSANVSKFTQESKRFNDWAISAGVGVPLVQSSDLTSIKNGNGKNLFGYSIYFSVDKAITHAFGLKFQYDRGETRQGWMNTKDAYVSGDGGARTQYDAISILGDINFSNLLRRVDNNSPYRWAIHGYAGIGTLAYRAYYKDGAGQRLMTEVKPFNNFNLFGQAGAGLKFKINKNLDLEGRIMYVLTGDDEFDGGGAQYSTLNQIEEQISDNFFNATLGLTLKLGKHQSHLFWHDPLQEVYYKLDILENKNQDIEVCKKGDADNDGVCDDWDRELNTPAGARVDGAGIALDTDLDGVIDLYDKCVTVPGPIENNGCPKAKEKAIPTQAIDVSEDVEKVLKDILFVFNKTEISPESYPKLDLAADIIKSSGGGTYVLVGQTDKKGNDLYNLNLSKGRARAVVKELEKRGVNPEQLKSIGVGEQMAVVPETASDEERLQDRRVSVRYVVGDEWHKMPKSDIAPAKKTTTKGKTKKKK